MAKPVLDAKSPEWKKKIGSMGGNTTKRRKGKNWYSKIAKLSHPRKKHAGGRPRLTPK